MRVRNPRRAPSLLAAAALAFGTASPSFAQNITRMPRGIQLSVAYASDGPYATCYGSENGGHLKVEYRDLQGVAWVSELAPLANWNGTLFCIPDLATGGGELLLAGTWWNGTGAPLGILERFSFAPSTKTFVPSGASFLPGSDLLGVVWHPSTCKLFLLDEAQQVLWSAPYHPGQTLPVAWGAFASFAQFTSKASLAGHALYLSNDEERLVIEESHVLDRDFEDAYEVDPIPVPPSFQTKISLDQRWAKVREDFPGPLHGASSLDLESPPAAHYAHLATSNSVTIEDLDSLQSVASAILAPSGASSIPLSSSLVIGRLYEIRTALFGRRTDVFIPTKNWGQCEPLPHSYSYEPISDGYAFNCYLGSEIFGVGTSIQWDETAPPPSANRAILVVGREQDVLQIDPQRALLVSPLQISTTLMGLDWERKRFVYADLPIPNDPALAQGILCFQWFLEPRPNEWYASNVRAFVVRSGDPLAETDGISAAARSSGSTSAGSVPEPRAAIDRRALRTWLTSAGGREVSRMEMQALFQSVLRR